MIIFNGTKSARGEFFLCFCNENGSVVEIPITEPIKDWFMRYIDRLSPTTKDVENSGLAESK